MRAESGGNLRPCVAVCSDLQEGLLLFQMLAEQWDDVVHLCRRPQLVSPATPVLVPPVLLL